MNRTQRPPFAPPANARRPGTPDENDAAAPWVPGEPAAAPGFALDPWSLLGPTLRSWPWLAGAGLLGALAGGGLGLLVWPESFRATAQLVRINAPVASDAYHPPVPSGPTLVTMVSSPETLDRVQARGSAAGGRPAVQLRAGTERNQELLTLTAEGRDAAAVTTRANAYADEVIRQTRELQRSDAEVANRYVAAELAAIAENLRVLRAELPEPPPVLPAVTPGLSAVADPLVAARITRLTTQVEEARDRLDGLLLDYTELHPQVRGQRALITELEARQQRALDSARAATPAPAAPVAAPPTAMRATTQGEWEVALQRLRTLESQQAQLLARHRAIQVFRTEPPGSFRLLQAADATTLSHRSPWPRAAALAGLLGACGLGLAAAERLRRELYDPRLKTEADLARVTGLPVLARLGDLRIMSEEDRAAWAFRAWVALQDRIARSPHHGLVCGLTSSAEGEGRTACLHLLAAAARRSGFRVLTIATRPDGAAATAPGTPAASPDTGDAQGAPGGPEPASLPATIAASAFFSPAVVTERLLAAGQDPLVHIPLPGWTWDLDRRRQWQSALEVWRRIDRAVILVELPPASQPESVLLASSLPNLVWLAEAGRADAAATRTQLATLRQARSHLVGAVLNRAPTPASGGRLARWVGALTLLAALAPGAPDLAAQPAPVPPDRLTLGPGDVLNLGLFGDREATREDVVVGPDGRLSFLEAQDIPAAGLTVDELRARLQQELAPYRRSPEATVIPVSYRSRNYIVLGKVARRGTFALDRPVTVLEAVARAGGIETGLGADRGLIELADLPRSFLARGGRRVPVDFGRLFAQGDLTQNVALEPGDYLCFPAASAAEVFVLGAVRYPGAHAFQGTVGALGAIAARGGFSERAWPRRVVVIRGGLSRPEVIPVDADEVLAAARPDVRLEPRDLVFVSERPWIRGEELLDAAAAAFVTAAVVTYTGEHITPTR